MLIGTSIIGFTRGNASDETFTAFDPSSGEAVEPQFFSASLDELELAVRLADEGRLPLVRTSPARRAAFLRSIANNIEELGDALIDALL